MKRSFSLILVSCAAVLALVLAACNAPVGFPPGTLTGKLQISVTNTINARTMVPPIDMTAASYTVAGTGPQNATFTATSTGAPITQTGLALGSWTIVVTAVNSSAQLVGSGSGNAQVNAGETTAVSVTVSPISGTGTLSLAVVWPASQVQTPSISATLAPALGTAQPLAFVVSGATASFLDAAVPNGYYTLALTLFNNGVAVAGAVDVVRIVAGQTTSGTITFSNVNIPGGTVQVTINSNLQNPLAVDLALASDGSTFSASVSNYTGTVAFGWYVNGVSQKTTGSSFTFGPGVAPGLYRIDVTAFIADGTRAGAATHDVQVTAPISGTGPAAVNLRTAGNYVILTQAGVTTTGATAITGDIGVSPIAAAAITGFGLILDASGQFSTSSLVTGRIFAADYAAPTPATLTTAVSDMQAAYADAAGRTSPDFLNLGAGTLAGNTLAPGLYTWGSAVSITSGITISGSASDVWIFQVGGALTVGNGVVITLAGGALPQNIFWQVAGVASLGTTAQMKGIILSSTAVTLNTGATVNGRLLAQTAVTLIGDTVSQP